MQPTKTQDEDITDKSGIITHWHKIKYYRKNANTTTNVEHVHCERENKTAKSVHPFGQTATLPFAMKQMHGSVMFSEIHPNIGTDISLISFKKKKIHTAHFHWNQWCLQQPYHKNNGASQSQEPPNVGFPQMPHLTPFLGGAAPPNQMNHKLAAHQSFDWFPTHHQLNWLERQNFVRSKVCNQFGEDSSCTHTLNIPKTTFLPLCVWNFGTKMTENEK